MNNKDRFALHRYFSDGSTLVEIVREQYSNNSGWYYIEVIHRINGETYAHSFPSRKIALQACDDLLNHWNMREFSVSDFKLVWFTDYNSIDNTGYYIEDKKSGWSYEYAFDSKEEAMEYLEKNTTKVLLQLIRIAPDITSEKYKNVIVD